MSHTYQPSDQNQSPDPFSLDQHELEVTFFTDKFAATKQVEVLTLHDLAGIIEEETALKKIKLPWLKLALFGDRATRKKCLRSNANMVELTGVEVEHDACTMPLAQAIERLRTAKVRCLVYTSPSFIPGKKEKWRVLAPLSTPVPAAVDTRLQLAARLNGVLEGAASTESFNHSQAYLYGSINGNPDHCVEVIDGDFIDLCDDLDEGAIGKPAPTPRETGNGPLPTGVAPGRDEAGIMALLEKSQWRNRDGSGNWHPSMLSAVASMVGLRWRDEKILQTCEPYSPLGLGDVEVLIASAREKWDRPDPDIDQATLMGEILQAEVIPRPVDLPNWRERYATGYPKASLHNARLGIEALGLKCLMDTFHNRMWLGSGEVNDTSIGALRMRLSIAFGLDFTERHVRDAVAIMCGENSFNPVVDMLAEAETAWDGVERLDRVAADYFNCEDTELNAACVRKTLLAAVARARQPGIKFDTILVMESKEGWNKSSAWSVLAGDDNFSDERIIGHATKEVQEQLAEVWIHENADLAGMRKAEVETVKTFASRRVDRARPAYGHFLKKQPRHSIEVGTTNARTYLQATTGNRRFWPVRVLKEIDLDRLQSARLQIWGEAAAAHTAGESLVLPRKLWATAGVEQEERRVAHPWEALLEGMVEVPGGGVAAGMKGYGPMVLTRIGDEHRVHTKDIFEHVLSVSGAQMNMGHSKTLSELMFLLGWTLKKVRIENVVTMGYTRPVIKNAKNASQAGAARTAGTAGTEKRNGF